MTKTIRNGKTASYTYNGDGLRMSKTVNGTITSHIWDGTNIAGDVTNGNVTKYIRGIQLISSKTGSNESFYTYNAHGDVVQITNGSGDITKQYSYDAFDVEQNKDANDINPFRYCGEYLDNETESIYLRARHYSPISGRFITEDPIRDGLNWYSYAANNPIIFVANGMQDQAEVRKGVYENRYETDCYIVVVDNAQDFAKKWNLWFSDKLAGKSIDAIEIISHGGATGDIGKDSSGTAYATGFLYFTDDANNMRLFARDTDDMNNTDASISWLDPVSD